MQTAEAREQRWKGKQERIGPNGVTVLELVGGRKIGLRERQVCFT